MNEIEVVQKEVLPIPEQAKMIVVRDQPSLSKANDFFLTIKALRKKIAQTFDPIIQKAHEAHKEALNQKSLIEAPLVTAEKYLNGQITVYHAEIELKRREEEERMLQEALIEEANRRKEREELKLKEAAELESSGLNEEAEALVSETIEENQKPIEVYVPPPATPKVELEGATVVTYWRARVDNFRALCKGVAEGKYPTAYIDPIDTKKEFWPTLDVLASRLKKELNVDGVKVVSTSSMRSTGKRRAA